MLLCLLLGATGHVSVPCHFRADTTAAGCHVSIPPYVSVVFLCCGCWPRECPLLPHSTFSAAGHHVSVPGYFLCHGQPLQPEVHIMSACLSWLLVAMGDGNGPRYLRLLPSHARQFSSLRLGVVSLRGHRVQCGAGIKSTLVMSSHPQDGRPHREAKVICHSRGSWHRATFSCRPPLRQGSRHPAPAWPTGALGIRTH